MGGDAFEWARGVVDRMRSTPREWLRNIMHPEVGLKITPKALNPPSAVHLSVLCAVMREEGLEYRVRGRRTVKAIYVYLNPSSTQASAPGLMVTRISGSPIVAGQECPEAPR